MENEKFVVTGGFALTSEDIRILSCILEQYIYEEEHHIGANGDVIKLDSPASWDKHPLAPIRDRLKFFSYSFDKGDTLLIKKSCS